MNVTRNITLESAIEDAKRDYTARNSKSLVNHQRALGPMPGGNTRSVLFYDPFPLTFTGGEGAYLFDVDGHKYTDFLGEFTAGLAGHSHPAIRKAVIAALEGGISLGGHNIYEPRFAEAVTARFPSMELVRFANSGTEANLLAISTAIAKTGRRKVMVMRNGYHGAVFTFSPGVARLIRAGRSPEETMRWPLTLRITSPGSSPAFSAGPPFSTMETRAPSGDSSLKESASVWLTSCTETPRRACSTLPVLTIWFLIFAATSIGTANDRP